MERTERRLNILVTPPGAFGMAMAVPFLANDHEVTLGFRSGEKAEEFRATCKSERLPGVTFPKNLKVTADLEQAVGSADLVVLATPARFLRTFYQQIAPFIRKDALLLCLTKGLEEGTNSRPSEVILDIDPEVQSRLGVLSGPNFAQDVANGLFNATDIASKKLETAERLARACHSRQFRVYPTDNLIGTELGGALKNVIAVAAGAADGMQIGESGRAAVITRGGAEMERLIIVSGGRWQGLSGEGDLWLTCTSFKSRNHWAGVELVRGSTPEELINSGKTIEGFYTAKAAVELAQQYNIEMPISNAVYQVVHNLVPVEEVMSQLLDRLPAYENGVKILSN